MTMAPQFCRSAVPRCHGIDYDGGTIPDIRGSQGYPHGHERREGQLRWLSLFVDGHVGVCIVLD